MEGRRDQVDDAGLPAPILLSLDPAATREGPGQWARLAGLPAWIDVPLRVLAPFTAGPPPSAAALDRPPRPALPRDHPGRGAIDIFEGIGFVGGRDRALRARRGASGWHLGVSGLGAFGVDAGGEMVAWLGAPNDSRPDPSELVSALLGPPLMLALATRGRWCLHGSAVRAGDGVIALLGVSGAGKSTLAAHLDERLPGARAADDVLAVTVGSPSRDGLWAWPALPQLKLSEDAQWRGPEVLPVRGVCVLEVAPRSRATVRAEPLSGRAAALAFVRHTVGALLFDPPLAGAHLRAGSLAARAAPWWRLQLPHHRAALDAAAAVLARIAEGLDAT